MNLLDILLEVGRSLKANKARTALTILGIVVGIASVIGLISIGQGTRTQIEGQIRSIGTTLLTITNTASSGEGLTDADMDALRQLSGVKAVTGVRSGTFDTVYGENTTSAQVQGVTPDYAALRSVEIARGSFISDYNNELAAHVAVISPTMVETFWGSEDAADQALGQTLRIGGVQFTVIGVTSSSGGSAIQAMSSSSSVYVPLNAATAALTGKGSYSSVYVEGTSEEGMTLLSTAAEQLLKSRHGYDPTGDESDFSIVDMSGMLSMASNVTGMLTGLLAAIASISLIVGGIGIMNMMLTTVTERTREIGLRKAIGATPGNVTLQFLVESIALTSLGGIIGVALGWTVATIINATGVLTTTVTLGPILLAVGVCMLIGILFGYWPARRAAKLNPIEALRYQ